MTRSLIQLFKDVGTSAVSDDRRRACVRHIWLMLEDVKRETAQPADVELDPLGAVWTDDASNVSRLDPSGAD